MVLPTGVEPVSRPYKELPLTIEHMGEYLE